MMGKSRRWHGLAPALLLLAAAGCKGLFGSHGLPDDPLFANRKPAEGKASQPAPPRWFRSEPRPPFNPYFADLRTGVQQASAAEHPSQANAMPQE